MVVTAGTATTDAAILVLIMNTLLSVAALRGGLLHVPQPSVGRPDQANVPELVAALGNMFPVVLGLGLPAGDVELGDAGREQTLVPEGGHQLGVLGLAGGGIGPGLISGRWPLAAGEEVGIAGLLLRRPLP